MKALVIRKATSEHSERLQIIGMYHDDLNYVVMEGENIVGYFDGQIGDGDYFYLKENEMYLEYIQVETGMKQGYGKSMLNAIFNTFPAINKIIAETNDDNKGFWKRVGASIPEEYSDECREIYEFTLTREGFQNAYHND